MKKSRVKYSTTAAKQRRISKRKFLSNFTNRNLEKVFFYRIANKDNAGIDGIHSHDLKKEESFEIINRKVQNGTYKFTPYAEIQLPKGRGKFPRIIALPTIRDQVVLSALKDYLHNVFSQNVNRKLANTYIYELDKEIQKIKENDQKCGFIRADISGFYDNIDREKLMNFIRCKVEIPEALKLIYRSIANPIVPRNNKRSQRFHYYAPKGIPQGLAISNILAGIYMSKFDTAINMVCKYFVRYVDDILIICPIVEIFNVMERLRFEISKLGLELNEKKTQTGVIGEDNFDFLGYKLKADGRISIRDTSVHRKISSLAGKITSADHKRHEFRNLHKIDLKTYKKVLVEDINEQITGVISESKKYGWLFYFSQINDITLLHRLDRIVEKLCSRCHTFLKRKPKAIKSFITSFREIHKLQQGVDSHYIPSYDDWDIRQKIEFLNNRGLLIETRKYTKVDIDRLFKITLHKRLLSLERDLRDMS